MNSEHLEALRAIVLASSVASGR